VSGNIPGTPNNAQEFKRAVLASHLNQADLPEIQDVNKYSPDCTFVKIIFVRIFVEKPIKKSNAATPMPQKNRLSK